MINFLKFYLTLFLLVFTLLSKNLLAIAEVNLVVLSGMILLDYFDKKSLSLFQVWLVGFIYIILSEAILIEPGINIIEAVKFLIVANCMILWGYMMPVKYKSRKNNYKLINQTKKSRLSPYILIVLVISYVLYSLPGAILTYRLGRNSAVGIMWEDRNIIISSFLSSLSFVLPSIIVYYYKEIRGKESILIPLLISMPIFAVLFVAGTRFPLLFSFGGFLIVAFAKSTGRIALNPKLIGLLFLLVTSSFLMGQFRTGGLAGFESFASETIKEPRLSKRLASKMSPEGVVDMTAMSITYFENNPHTHGKSIAFLTYFWVPRSIWPDKPTMLGHWMIRKYRSGFGEGHSSSFGFTGELFADFGYFSLFFVFLLGVLLKRADMYRAFQLAQPMSYSKILVAMMFSYVFFFVRSPVTSSINFIGILLVYSLIRRLLFKKLDTETVVKNSVN